MPPRHLHATLVKKTFLTPTVMLARFRVAGGAKLDFRPGQYLILHLPMGKDISERPFSLASPPARGQTLELLVRLVAGGVASMFFTTSPVGRRVMLTGPHGSFAITAARKPLCLIASGTGLAPFRSALAELLERQRVKTPVRLALVVPSREEIFLEHELQHLALRHPTFHYEIVLDLADYLARLSVGSDEEVYLCGGINFVADITRVLLARGVRRRQIHAEKFV